MLSLRTRSGGPLVALSTASVFPERVADAFEIAARLGYDRLEVMVSADAVSQDIEALRRLADYHRVPLLALHAACPLVPQRVGVGCCAGGAGGPARGGREGPGRNGCCGCPRRSAGSATTPPASPPGW